MKRQHQADINTAGHYDDLYFGIRTNELMAYPLTINFTQTFFKNGRVLDVGCGLGRYFPFFNNCEVVGVDFAEKTCEEARKAHPSAQVDCHDIAKNGLSIYPDASFEYILCAEVIEHMENPQALIDEIHRVLKPGGLAVITTPFEDRIVCEEHLWEYTDQDLYALMAKFQHPMIMRYYNVREADWEHFIIIASK